MITILHRGGGGSLGTPKSDYVICARPHMKVATLITMLVWFRITSQVPYESTKFCQSCGIVKEPFTLDKDIAFQVNNVNSKGRDSLGIWTCRSGTMMILLITMICDSLRLVIVVVALKHPSCAWSLTGWWWWSGWCWSWSLNTFLWSTQAHYHRRGDN